MNNEEEILKINQQIKELQEKKEHLLGCKYSYLIGEYIMFENMFKKTVGKVSDVSYDKDDATTLCITLGFHFDVVKWGDIFEFSYGNLTVIKPTELTVQLHKGFNVIPKDRYEKEFESFRNRVINGGVLKYGDKAIENADKGEN